MGSQEQHALSTLYQRFDECSKQKIYIQKILRDSNESKLNQSHIQCTKDINNTFDEIIKQLTIKKHQLLNNIDNITKIKQELLNKQLNMIQNEYISLLYHGKSEYESYVKGQNKQLN